MSHHPHVPMSGSGSSLPGLSVGSSRWREHPRSMEHPAVCGAIKWERTQMKNWETMGPSLYKWRFSWENILRTPSLTQKKIRTVRAARKTQKHQMLDAMGWPKRGSFSTISPVPNHFFGVTGLLCINIYIYINRVYFPVFIYPVARHDSSSRILSH